ncbi:DUF2589 domain-containing protein [Fulvivirga sp.]|uniref:DUF2589 domain-containing protein n=1 Tax=Fulvivirga sp. TaxID=1931237 RepID=UPI0032ED02C7
MARQLSELQSLPFHQIIGAPLTAIVEGQAQAAQATAEFIERIGFAQPTEGQTGEIGKLRMISFSYSKPDVNGEMKEYRLEIPLLSMVPIPSIEVKEAELEFNIKVADVQKVQRQTQLADSNAEVGNWAAKEGIELRTTMGKMSGSESRNVDIQMNVKMKLQQADIPEGVQHLFRVMDQTINSEEIKTPDNAENVE